MAHLFETQTCTRCGGSGRFSFNLSDGDRCYGCGGTGLQLTKRGKAARTLFKSLLERPASEVKVGEFVLMSVGVAGPERWHTVAAIAPCGSYSAQGLDGVLFELTRKGKPACGYGCPATAMVQSVRNEEHRQELVAQALAYQATLNKLGKPAKRAGVAA